MTIKVLCAACYERVKSYVRTFFKKPGRRVDGPVIFHVVTLFGILALRGSFGLIGAIPSGYIQVSEFSVMCGLDCSEACHHCDKHHSECGGDFHFRHRDTQKQGNQSFVPAGEFCFQLRKGRHLLIRANENTTSRSFVFAQQLQREWDRR